MAGRETAPGRDTEGGSDSYIAASAYEVDDTPVGYLTAVDKLTALAAAQGFVVGIRCSVCGGVLTARRSRALGIGPRCLRRAVSA